MRLTKVETKGAVEVMKLSISWCHSKCRLCVKYQYSAFFGHNAIIFLRSNHIL
jgi:hypothetical protein